MSGLIQLMIATPAERIDKAVRDIVKHEFSVQDSGPGRYKRIMALAEKPLIEAVLKHCGGNLSHAASTLGIHRNSLRAKIRRHGVKV